MGGVQLNTRRHAIGSGIGGRTPLFLPGVGRDDDHPPQQRLSTSAVASGVELSVR